MAAGHGVRGLEDVVIVPEFNSPLYWDAPFPEPKGSALTRDVHESEGRKAPLGFRMREPDPPRRPIPHWFHDWLEEPEEWYAREVERMRERAPA